jgi:hypothetical protein
MSTPKNLIVFIDLSIKSTFLSLFSHNIISYQPAYKKTKASVFLHQNKDSAHKKALSGLDDFYQLYLSK